jgi:hypothetical protein
MKHGFRPRRTKKPPREIVELKTFDGYVVENWSFVLREDEIARGRIVDARDYAAQRRAFDAYLDRAYAEVVCPVCGNRDAGPAVDVVAIAAGRQAAPPCSRGFGECPGRMLPGVVPAPRQGLLPAPRQATFFSSIPFVVSPPSVKIEPVALS